MSRRVALLMATAGMAVMVPALAGVALAAVITCTGGRCEGTNEPDQITGTDQRDRIFALDGSDEVEARAGEDDLNGGNGGDRLLGEDNNALTSAAGAKIVSARRAAIRATTR